MKSIFLHGAIDIIILVLIICACFTQTLFFSLAWIINTIYLVGLTLWFIYDVSILGDKIEKYINNKNTKEN